MKGLHMVTFLLLVVGGLYWGLIGLSPDWNLVAVVGESLFARIVYVLVGLSALFELFTHKRCCNVCSVKKMDKGMHTEGGNMGGGM